MLLLVRAWHAAVANYFIFYFFPDGLGWATRSTRCLNADFVTRARA